ncbi:nucleophile aminohydrolase [Aspergillus pseudonomiae]|uniref:Nucleophile aminohydrolase n=1 Tax=Aspergillus pseudonomiae TaxID=1506151 RepID=A0A5N6I7V2_9EURO|nr:nucleophile aminohydrolase [Aspergillus pseudonomiae]KAB8262752.1 nucleophile aminohydrolase [Aspergillus pseudonomiae]KAE8409673.1 nucleophile aminohydrolase [Aspergillus pseudonomiae]
MDKSKPYPQQRKPLFKPTLIIHGGAGALKRSTLPPSLYAQYQTSLLTYLRSTHSLLKSGSTALDAAVHAVTLLEDDELFNCGRGSVFTSAGTIEMEASVMVTSLVSDDSSDYPGSTKRGAGVMGLRNVRHPILAAKESLLRTGYGGEDGGSMHSQLVAPYVEEKAREWGLEFMHDEWFWTQRRWDEHLRGLRGEPEPISFSQGTVGCVCLDMWGGMAVATSTGGLTNKWPGRIGDTPTLGGGFWAEGWDVQSNTVVDGEEREGRGGLLDGMLGDCLSFFNSRGEGYVSLPMEVPMERRLGEKMVMCSSPENRVKRRAAAVSGTGNGDSFLRVAAARTACAMVRFSERTPTLADAVAAVSGPGGELQRSAGRRWGVTREGEGGIIGIEAEVEVDEDTGVPVPGMQLGRGQVVFDFNCGGMWRAWVEEDGDGNDLENVMVFREPY